MPKKVPKSICLSSKVRKMLTIACAILVFLFALGITLYPLISIWYNSRHQSEIHTQYLEVLRQVDNSEIILAERYANEYNAAISPGTQLSDAFSKEALLWASEDYENLLNLAGDGIMGYIEIPMIQVNLADYGLESEVFAVISIPALELEMPVFLGANYRHMADGAAILSQTSIPIGGKNTNCIIAGHRGWGGASYFRYVDKLQPGDEVIITNLWETLQYRVAEIQIIQPNEVEQILIKPGQELVTLLTCHPYASGGRQRYLVICERVNENN